MVIDHLLTGMILQVGGFYSQSSAFGTNGTNIWVGGGTLLAEAFPDQQKSGDRNFWYEMGPKTFGTRWAHHPL